MSKTCKKLLASALAAAMLITTFVSSFVVSAATTGTLTIEDTTITVGAEEAVVNFKLAFDAFVEAPHELATITANPALTIKDIALGDVTYETAPVDPEDPEIESPALKIKTDGINKNAGKVLFESGVDGAVKASEINFTVTFDTTEAAVGTYTVSAAIASTDINEADIVVNCDDTGAIVVEEDKPAVHEHEWVWTYNSENFNYDGVCACEATTTKELEISEEATSITLSGKALMLEDAVTVVYYLVDDDVAAYDGFYALVERTAPTGVIPEKLNGVPSTVYPGEYEFLYKGVAAKMLNDNLDITVYAVKDGVAYPNATISYNVISYAESKLKSAKTEATLKTTLVDLLNFGAEAQKYFKYNASNLANAWLSEEYLALGTATDFIPEMTNNRNYGDNNANMPVENTSPALELESSVYINYFMNPKKYVDAGGSLDNLTLVVQTGGKVAAEIPFEEFLPLTTNGVTEYRAAFKGLKSFQMRDLCYFTVYENYGTDSAVAVSDTMIYSIESYAAGRKTTATVYNTAMAMMRYGDSAYNHFKK